MNAKQTKQSNTKVIKDMKAKKDFKPGDLLKSKRKLSKRTLVSVMGLV